MLLTSGQVSMAISSSIVFVFTSLLFLAGYVLQQQTVHSLQAAIKPRLPPTPPPPLPDANSSSTSSSLALSTNDSVNENNIKPPRASTVDSRAHTATQAYLSPKQPSEAAADVDWRTLAHVQLVASHAAVCSAIMLFGDLARQRSPARRVLLFPRSWAVEKRRAKKGAVADPYLDTSRRLLRLAARRYGVVLQPVEPLQAGMEGEGVDEDDPSAYSLASLWGLAEFERVLWLRTPGLLLDAAPLDALLAFEPVQGTADIAAEVLLVRPSAEEFGRLAAAAAASSPSTSATGVFQSSTTLLPNVAALLATTAALYNTSDSFNATAYLHAAAYVRIADAGLPGPEFDVPLAAKVRARPLRTQAERVWSELYERFRQRRMDVCGLDLEPWREGLQGEEDEERKEKKRG
ncbi:hypothetical protein B0A49_00311 [Cryomyces minteri]|uniref:Uncharacterized protein n=1 Tax=Cryomyces minteri TaxID=331657 RepID=A0A4U0XU46_9PEZI|nr:hypothetical protein B0A49_00311 [Cryomyces minteri]